MCVQAHICPALLDGPFWLALTVRISMKCRHVYPLDVNEKQSTCIFIEDNQIDNPPTFPKYSITSLYRMQAIQRSVLPTNQIFLPIYLK